MQDSRNLTKLKQVALVLIISLALTLISTFQTSALSLGGQLDLNIDYSRETDTFDAGGTLGIDMSSWAGDNIHLRTGLNLDFTEDRVTADIDEANLTYFGQDVDIILGWQKITWGAVDNNSPVDNLNPRDLSDPFSEDNKISVPAIRTAYFHSEIDFDLVWQPYAVGWNLPGITAEMPERTIENSVAGIRAGYSAPAFDLAASYFRGVAAEPAAIISETGEVEGLEHFREQVIGAEMVYEYSGVILRADLALAIPEEGEFYPENELRYAATLESNITPDLLMMLGIQGSNEIDQDSENTAVVSLNYLYDFYTEISLGFGYGINEGDFIINPEFSRDLADGLELKIGAYYFNGEAGPYGQFSDQDQLYLSLSQSF